MQQMLKVGFILLGCAVWSATAQDWYHEREARFRGEGWRSHVFAHVRTDLDHLGSIAFTAPREKQRTENTKRELTDLQAKLDHGRFDQGELNDVIDSMRKSANDQRLSPRDREVLSDDLNRILDYQAHHDHWIR